MKPRTLLALLLIAGAVYFLYLSFYERGQTVLVGTAAPNFTLPSAEGMVSLDQFRGQVVLLNFWASWCPPCVAEMPSLERLHRRMQGSDFVVLAVSEDEEGWPAIKRFLQAVPLTMTILPDARGDAAELYGTFQLPQTFLIDKSGVIVRKYSGPRNWIDARILSEVQKHVEGP